jgi:FAD/FMN-containing dehydrogenase
VLDVEPGALVGAVLKAGLAVGETLPVVPDALMLSMGGLLSVGGTGEASHRSGALVDHVEELDVVTGAGELVTCSRERNEELFHMTLAGLGQCGLIVRARLRLVRAPSHVAIQRLTYRDAGAFVDDQARLAGRESLGTLAGEISRGPDGGWQFAVLAGMFLARSEETAGRPLWMEGLGHSAAAPPAVTPLWEFLDRRAASVAATKAAGRPNPSIAFYLPQRSVGPFLSHVLSTPEASIGIWRIEVLPLTTAPFTQPLHVLPEGPVAFALRLQRRASAEKASDHAAMLEANRSLWPRLLAAGGKIYPPYSPIPTHDEWRGHYGAETWARFAAAKERFDPNHVLTPGAGLF